MKQCIRIGALVLALLLLTGCFNSSDLEGDRPSTETTIPTAFDNPAVSTDNDPAGASTMPTDVTPTETAAPTTATIPTDTAPTETAAPTTTTMPTDPIETTVPTDTTETPATPTPAASAGFGAVYADICRLLNTGVWDLEYTYATIGMMEVVESQNTKAGRYSSITYALEDINNDGSREMIVLDAMGNTRILAIFAIQNSQPVMTHEGGYRARIYKLVDGTLYFEGSNGAAYSIFEAYGQCWFTYPKGEDQLETGYYYAADGSYDPTKAQEITSDEYNAKQVEFAQKITAFSVYNFS